MNQQSSPGYISGNNENTNSEYTCTPLFIAALFTIARIRKQHKYPSRDEWIRCGTYIQ